MPRRRWAVRPAAAQHRQGVVERLVSAKVVAQHGIAAHFRLLGVEDLPGQCQKWCFTAGFIVGQQFVREVVGVAQPEVQLLKPDLSTHYSYGPGQTRICCLGAVHCLARPVEEEQDAHCVLLPACDWSIGVCVLYLIHLVRVWPPDHSRAPFCFNL